MIIRSHNRLLFTKLRLLKNLKKTVTHENCSKISKLQYTFTPCITVIENAVVYWLAHQIKQSGLRSWVKQFTLKPNLSPSCVNTALCSLMDHEAKKGRCKWGPPNFMLNGGGLRDRLEFHPGEERNINSSRLLHATETRINPASMGH